MHSFWPAIVLTGPLLAGPSIFLARIERTGLPPCEGEQGRIYILKGEACGTLRQGGQVLLRRPENRLGVGRLTIIQVADGYAVGKLVEAGASYPLKGDEAIAVEEPAPASQRPLPEPASLPAPRKTKGVRRPKAPGLTPGPKAAAPGARTPAPDQAVTPPVRASVPSLKPKPALAKVPPLAPPPVPEALPVAEPVELVEPPVPAGGQ
jgi:hypothetical protein